MVDDWKNYQEDKKEINLFDFVAEDSGLIQGVFLASLVKGESDVVWQKQPIGEVKHVFSHRKWHILLGHGFVKKEQERPLKENQAWVHPDDFESFVFPKPQQKMVAFLNK